MTETNFQALDINQLDNETGDGDSTRSMKPLYNPLVSDICYVLLNLCAPPGLSRTKKRFLKMKTSKVLCYR